MNEQILETINKQTQLSLAEIMEFLALGNLKNISKKEALLKPQQVVDKSYFLIDGTIRHYIVNNGDQFTKNLIRGPRFMLPSLTSFFLGTASSIYCEALTDLKVIEWKRENLMQFADEHPKMYKFLLKAVASAFKGKESKEIAFITQTAEQRYQQFLLDFPNLINEIPVQIVASYLGIRPETLSRIRAKRIS